MRALTAIVVLIAGITYALPAQCERCYRGAACYTDSFCGECSCIRINGLGKAGVCG